MKARDCACDSSALVAAHTGWHPRHAEALAALDESVRSVPAHAMLECYSVLTRLPPPHRIDPGAVAAALGALAVELIGLPAERHPSLIADLAGSGYRGGATYDALIAATALEHLLVLLTSDRRAVPVYEAVGAEYRML